MLHQSLDLNPTEHRFHSLKAKRPKNKQEMKTAAVKAWPSLTREQTRCLVVCVLLAHYTLKATIRLTDHEH